MAHTDDGEPFDAALLAAFARVIILWSYVEQLQGQLLSFLLNAEAGRVFVISQNVSASTVTGWIRVLLQIPAVQATGIGDLSELRRRSTMYGLNGTPWRIPRIFARRGKGSDRSMEPDGGC
jgi:hypothetical protein